MSVSHRYTDSQGTAYSEDVDSAATTLLASPRSRSSEGKGSWEDEEYSARKYADIELDRFDERERRKRCEDDGSASDGGDDEGEREDDHLLASETSTALTRQPSAANTIADDVEPPPPPVDEKSKKQPVSWSQLPRKSQLAILTLARLSEPLTQTSLQSYMFYQLKSFKLPDASTPSDSTVARQAGILAAAFTGAQFCVAMMWGRLADWEGMGRKRVILIGLLGTAIGSLGFGFSQSFAVAVFWRWIGGMLNGNMGVMRTMISEIIKEKKFQSRAFLLLPMTFNVGVIIGPLIGGLLADPVGSYPGIFGPGGSLGGKEGVWWLTKWPYALPNVVNATFLCCSALGVTFGLEETLEGLKDRPDYGLRFSRWVGRTIFRMRSRHGYASIPHAEHEGPEEDVELMAPSKKRDQKKPQVRRKLPFRRIWTANVLFTLLAHGLLAMHVGTFSNLWFVFLSTPRYDPARVRHTTPRSAEAASNEPLKTVPENYHPHAPFTFTGGLALPPPSIGTALAILGVIGISLQLLLYPRLSFRLGTIRSFRLSILLFPLSYFLTPYLAVLPSSRAPPGQASGFFVWAGITLVLCVQVMARTFSLPASAILVNNSCPHPSVLGTIHGIAQSVSSLTRTVGPVLAGWIYGVGLARGAVGLAWWCMAGIACLGAIAGRFVVEGDGHEIWLEGERED